MSLTRVNMAVIVKKQYRFKLKAYIQVLLSLIFIQVLALLFSLNGSASMGSTSGMLSVDLTYYSADFVVAFTMLWGFITAILITTKAYRNDDFVFVTNRATSNLANILFLLTASVIGGITAILSSFLLRVVVNIFMNGIFVKSTQVVSAPAEFLLGIYSTTLYIFLICAVGYLVGTLVQINKLFSVLLPAAFFGALILDGLNGKVGVIGKTFEFFYTESSLVIFAVKVIVTVGLLFAAAAGLSNRLEVKS